MFIYIYTYIFLCIHIMNVLFFIYFEEERRKGYIASIKYDILIVEGEVSGMRDKRKRD